MQSREERCARRQIGGNGECRRLGPLDTYGLPPGRIVIGLCDGKLINVLFGQFLLGPGFRAQ
jgi:hypothetical protein